MISSAKIAKLANLPIKDSEVELFSKQLTSILDIVSKLQKVDTEGIVPTAQVTGQNTVLRDDEIDASRTFSQEEALANAKKTKNGFFVVPAVFE